MNGEDPWECTYKCPRFKFLLLCNGCPNVWLHLYVVFLNWVSVPLKAGNTASFCFEIPILVDAFVYLLIFSLTRSWIYTNVCQASLGKASTPDLQSGSCTRQHCLMMMRPAACLSCTSHFKMGAMQCICVCINNVNSTLCIVLVFTFVCYMYKLGQWYLEKS